MKNTHKILLITTLLSSYSIAQAQGMSFMNFDADNNGVVSEQEFNDAKTKRIAARALEGRQMRGLANALDFSAIDANHDGQLTPDEMQSMQQRMQQARANKASGDNTMARPPKPVFADFDANKDNSLTQQEYNEARNKRIGDRAKEGRQMRGLANMASFADIDVNADGKISPEEFTSFMLEHEKNAH